FNYAEEWYSSSIPVGAPDGQAALLPISTVGEIEKVPGVAAAFPGYAFDMKPGQVSTVSLAIPDTIVAYDPREAQYQAVKTSIAQGANLSATSRGEVVLGASVANEFKMHVGDRIDLPVRPKDAPPTFVNHPFTVAGILNATGTVPDSYAYIGDADA